MKYEITPQKLIRLLKKGVKTKNITIHDGFIKFGVKDTTLVIHEAKDIFEFNSQEELDSFINTLIDEIKDGIKFLKHCRKRV